MTAEPSAATNATAADGTYREHNASSFPADDATPIPPRAVPASWDYECDICAVSYTHLDGAISLVDAVLIPRTSLQEVSFVQMKSSATLMRLRRKDVYKRQRTFCPATRP